jgi:signal transduction histidine kinase
MPVEPMAYARTETGSLDVANLERLATLGAHSAGLAHELKNALVPVKTMLQLLLERHPDADLGEMANRELARIDSLISQMLLVSSPAPAQKEQVRVHALLDYTLRLLQKQMEEKSIRVQNTHLADSDHVSGNGHQLQQALMNLILNSLDSMNPGGTLTLVTRNSTPNRTHPDASGEICISITDTGCGISAENLPRLFEPFFTTKQGGTGLGLHLTQRVVMEHQGLISAESTIGTGTTFHLALPLAKSR